MVILLCFLSVLLFSFIIIAEPKIDKNHETKTYLIWYNHNHKRKFIDTYIAFHEERTMD